MDTILTLAEPAWSWMPITLTVTVLLLCAPPLLWFGLQRLRSPQPAPKPEPAKLSWTGIVWCVVCGLLIFLFAQLD